jgi:penicillin-binding protein 1A
LYLLVTVKATLGPRRKLKRNLKLIAGYSTLAVLVVAVVLQIRFAFALKSASNLMEALPDKIKLATSKPTRIFSADGKLLYVVSREYREPVTLKEVPQHVINAILAAEDKRFWDHQGIDYQSMGRVLANAGRKGGGSTLTMQLAKRMYTSSERSLDRKLQDLALAVTMERELTKEQILELYLNEVYYGASANGIKAASKIYFGKDPRDLTIAEAALIARCVRLPSRENPFVDLEQAVANRNDVLQIMFEEGMITRPQLDQAKQERPKLVPRSLGSGARVLSAPYAVMHVLDVLHKEFPDVDLATAGLDVHTTIDSRLQRFAQRAVRDTVRQYRRRKITTGAFLVTDRNGAILAEVGGIDFNRNQYSVVFQGKRQPGSAFKPFVYAAALSVGTLQPDDTISNERFTWINPYTGKPWSPKNSHGYGGYVTIEDAIRNSINVPAVRVIDALTPESAVAFAQESFGFQSKLDPVLPLALGSSAVSPLELSEAYSVFMLRGDRARPYVITKVLGPDGNLLKSYEPDVFRGVLSQPVCDLMDGYLRSAVVNGTGYKAAGVANARGKTGTTSNNLDAWFCGYTDRLLGVGWVGNEYLEGKSWKYGAMSSSVFGGTVTAEIWARIIGEAERMIDDEGLVRPQAEPAGPQVEIYARRLDFEPVEEDQGGYEPMEETPREEDYRWNGPIAYVRPHRSPWR